MQEGSLTQIFMHLQRLRERAQTICCPQVFGPDSQDRRAGGPGQMRGRMKSFRAASSAAHVPEISETHTFQACHDLREFRLFADSQFVIGDLQH